MGCYEDQVKGDMQKELGQCSQISLMVKSNIQWFTLVQGPFWSARAYAATVVGYFECYSLVVIISRRTILLGKPRWLSFPGKEGKCDWVTLLYSRNWQIIIKKMWPSGRTEVWQTVKCPHAIQCCHLLIVPLPVEHPAPGLSLCHYYYFYYL